MKKSVTISIKISEEEAKILDAKRGEKSRSEYFRECITKDENKDNLLEEVISLCTNSLYLQRGFVASLGHHDLAKEAKKAADEHVKEILGA